MLVGVDRPPSFLTPGPLLVGGMLLVATLVSVVTCGPTRGGHVTRDTWSRPASWWRLHNEDWHLASSDHGIEIVLILAPGARVWSVICSHDSIACPQSNSWTSHESLPELKENPFVRLWTLSQAQWMFIIHGNEEAAGDYYWCDTQMWLFFHHRHEISRVSYDHCG